MSRHRPVAAVVTCVLLFAPTAFAGQLPERDQRAQEVKTLNTPRAFPEIKSKAQWQTRAAEMRKHILVSCGLWPLPEKTSLEASVFGRIEREGYSVEKVHIQTYPGFYLAGNLYRPLGQGEGPFPGVLNPHGHWGAGRLEDGESGSIAARCINFAKQGMVAFSYDMVGYNDTAQLGPHRQFAVDPTNLLWNVSLMGLQTWNSIRALDFLESLPDVDRNRLACTGASGGGTQTFMLGAVDDRLAAQAPNVMVSHSMQGGCLCENAPGLRVDYSNMEIAAVPAPRPQILVAATGDWTRATMTIEGPAIESIYALFKAKDRFRHVLFDFNHNYNRTSREAVYGWFGKWLLNRGDSAAMAELAYRKESNDVLRVFPDGKLPEDALSHSELVDHLIGVAKDQLEARKPTDPASLARWKEVYRPAWQHTVQVEFPEKNLIVEAGEITKADGLTYSRLAIGREGRGDRLPVLMVTPARDNLRSLAVLAHPEGQSAYLDEEGKPRGLARRLLDGGQSVVLLDAFLTGTLADAEAAEARDHFKNFFSVYNRTDLQERAQDLVTACAFAHLHGKGRRVVLCGAGQAGLWALLAAPAADALVADCNQLEVSSDAALLQQDLFIPGIRRTGAFAGSASLATPNPLLLHNGGERIAGDWLKAAYSAAKASERLSVRAGAMSEQELAEWIVSSAARR